MTQSHSLTYTEAGVNTHSEVAAVRLMSQCLLKTFDFRPSNRPRLGMDYFANVIPVTSDLGIALSTDGVGTKVLIAQKMGRYDTIGIDCVATNVNDVLSVGAEPVALLDYIAIEQVPDAEIFRQLGEGLAAGAKLAGISIPGGETAQLGDIIRGEPGGYAMDLVGTCIGTVPLDRIVTGRTLDSGDIILGLQSSGVHSNGLTLARRVCFEKLGLAMDSYVADFGRSVGEELLEPTRIYAKEVVALLHAGLVPRALVNITSDGFLNLTRVYRDVSFVIDSLPVPHAIFDFIHNAGGVSIEEMYHVYNMGIGFCVVVSPDDCSKALQILSTVGTDVYRIGHVVADGRRQVEVRPAHLVGSDGAFHRV